LLARYFGSHKTPSLISIQCRGYERVGLCHHGVYRNFTCLPSANDSNMANSFAILHFNLFLTRELIWLTRKQSSYIETTLEPNLDNPRALDDSFSKLLQCGNLIQQRLTSIMIVFQACKPNQCAATVFHRCFL